MTPEPANNKKSAKGYKQHARSEANAAIKLAANRDVEGVAGLALARAGDLAAAEK